MRAHTTSDSNIIAAVPVGAADHWTLSLGIPRLILAFISVPRLCPLLGQAFLPAQETDDRHEV